MLRLNPGQIQRNPIVMLAGACCEATRLHLIQKIKHITQERLCSKACMRTLFLVLALAFLALPLFAQQEAAPPAVQKDVAKDQENVPDKDQGKIPVFRKNVTVVNVLFTVKDKHGLLIPNLEKDHFDLLEEGKPQTIKYFSALTDQPLT